MMGKSRNLVVQEHEEDMQQAVVPKSSQVVIDFDRVHTGLMNWDEQQEKTEAGVKDVANELKRYSEPGRKPGPSLGEISKLREKLQEQKQSVDQLEQKTKSSFLDATWVFATGTREDRIVEVMKKRRPRVEQLMAEFRRLDQSLQELEADEKERLYELNRSRRNTVLLLVPRLLSTIVYASYSLLSAGYRRFVAYRNPAENIIQV